MIRSLHRWPGLIAALLLGIMALSGAGLALFPAAEAISAPGAGGISVAELASRIQQRQPSVEQIRRAPSGKITAYFYEGDQPAAAVIDPVTGGPLGSADPSPVLLFLTDLHRSLFLGDSGRMITGTGSALMLVLSLSGLFLVARRMGGWKKLLSPLRGLDRGRLHVAIARLTVTGLILSSLTGLWITGSTFGFLPESAGPPTFPAAVSGQTGVALSSMPLLQAVPLDGFRSLTFPAHGDATDVFTLKTTSGEGFIDQGTGQTLAWKEAGLWEKTGDWIMRLHTGQGLSIVGLLLGLSALGVPVLAWTGIRLWLAGLRKRRVGAVPAEDANIVILVGSEGGTTWAFADTLQSVLTKAGARVHTAALRDFAPATWPAMRRLLILTATYGEGEAPASAKGFLERLSSLDQTVRVPVAVLGFGDRSFPDFAGYAEAISRALRDNGWTQFLPLDTVDRQSPQDFARWGLSLSQALGKTFELNHQPQGPAKAGLRLISRRDYGEGVQAPTSILRFALPEASLLDRMTGCGPFARFEAGDLIGVVPEGSTLPRFYSLASGNRDGYVEICVRRQQGGLCSSQLTALEPGNSIHAFLQCNPGFRPRKEMPSVLLIGAGTGIGPLAGFIRGNAAGQPMHLFFGARHADSDSLYAEDVAQWREDGRLASFTPAYSRAEQPRYVQQALRDDAQRVARLIAGGGQVLVCGGREMAAGVAAALTDILSGCGLSVQDLKTEGRYAEDVY